MSKNGFKKFRKNDYSYDDEEEQAYSLRNQNDRRKEKRVERALRTKDVSYLIEEEEDEWNDEQDNYREQR